MVSDALLVDRPADGVALITLNRPDSHNAITMALQAELDQVLTQLERDGETRCLVLAGAGERAFSAGYDLHEMADWSADELALKLLERERWVWHFAETDLPIIVALQGTVYGAGAILASAADVRVGAATTEFRFTAAAYNGANATWSLARFIGHGAASEFLLTARRVDSEEAMRVGLLNRIVEDPVTASCELAEQIAANPSGGTRAIKHVLRCGTGRTLEQAFEAKSVLMRTDLRPRPILETYAKRDGSFVPTPRPS